MGGGMGVGGGGRVVAGGGGFRGGFAAGSGFRGGFGFRGNGFGFRGFGNRAFFGSSFFLPYWGFAPYYDFGYSSYYPSYFDTNPYSSGYAGYQPSPNVTVVYPPQQATAQPLSVDRARPVTREYDQYGQEVRPAGSPLYLIAFKDHTIRAASSYQVDGNTLHYVTREGEQKEAALDTVDRAFTMQLNRERQVPFQLPPQ